jgi:hypothetical protein
MIISSVYSFLARLPQFRSKPDTLALRQQVQSVTVFSQTTIANLAIAKDLFDAPEWASLWRWL